MQKIKITFEQLDNYAKYCRDNPKQKISLNEYIQGENTEEVQADLSEIIFDQFLDLSNLDLSGTILPKELSGKYVFIEGADLTGCSFANTKFTDCINLAKVKLGSVALNKKVFQLCRLKDAIYTPSESNIVKVSVTDKQLKSFLDSKKQVNLNDYLSSLLKDKYPADSIIVADLNGRVIDEKFSNKDLSGSFIENTVFKGTIENLQLRDATTHNTLFSDCELIDPDLRGTCLVAKIREDGFEAASFIGKNLFIRPKMSIGSNDVSLINRDDDTYYAGQDFDSCGGELSVEDVMIDPCYVNGDDPKKVKQLVSCTREDLENYAKENKDLDANKKAKSFHEWKGLKEDEIADFSYQDLSNISIKGTLQHQKLSPNFQNCNFAYADLSGTNLECITFERCNFSGAIFSKDVSFSQKFLRYFTSSTKPESVASLKESVFSECCFDKAIMNHVSLENASLENINGINLQGNNLNIKGVKAKNCDLKGSNLDYIDAGKIEANNANWSYTRFRYGQFSGLVENSDFTKADGQNSKFKELTIKKGNFNDTDLERAEFNGARIEQTRLQADIDRAKMFGCSLNESDLAGLIGAFKDLKDVDFSLAIMSIEQAHHEIEQLKKNKERKEKEIYNQYSVYIALGSVAAAGLCASFPYVILQLTPPLVGNAIAFTATPICLGVGISIGTTALIAIGCDKLFNHYSGADIGFTKYFANKLGAEKKCANLNQELNQNIEKEKAKLNDLEKKTKDMPNLEEKIKNACKKRYSPKTQEKSEHQKRVKEERTERVISR